MGQEPENLRAEIVKVYGTIHRFCRRRDELNRPTVYMVLKGTYPGDTDKQIEKIRTALSGGDKRELVFKSIKSVACSKCSKSCECNQCDKLFRDQAEAVLQNFSF